jgi:hypothetical protein
MQFDSPSFFSFKRLFHDMMLNVQTGVVLCCFKTWLAENIGMD